MPTWKWSVGVAGRAFVAGDRAVDRERVAVGRVEGEVLAVEIDQDRAQPQRDAAEDLRQRVRDGRHLGGGRVDLSAIRTTTLPRSYGPETAGVTTARLSGAPL